MVSADFRRQLKGFGFTTANILYRMPDHPGILQSCNRSASLRPASSLSRIAEISAVFRSRELDGPLHSVTVAHADLIKPAEFKAISGEFRLN